MWLFNGKKTENARLDRKILRKNDISLLLLDERWNKLFVNNQKTPEIAACEDKLTGLFKSQARLLAEEKENAADKKKCMDMILKLTPAVFDAGDAAAKEEMQNCEKEIKKLNDRSAKNQEELDAIPDKIRDVNLELLENTVKAVYFKIRTEQKRVEELSALIAETRERLKAYIDEKETLSQDHTDTYSYFHDLLGGEELERLDKLYFGS